MASDLESQMVSVERVKSYSVMKQEAPHNRMTDPIIHVGSTGAAEGPTTTTWPTVGKIEFRSVVLRYRTGLPAVLDNLSFIVRGREKIGIVGRTGAGKSSIVTALLRLVELEGGCVLIDGMDVSALGLNTLRSIMAVIPQDPVLFSGTIKSNLDPFNKYSDLQLWDGLRRCLLADGCVRNLDDKVLENGSNFSVGQRQLLCICRALLSKATIIIMDEATAAVDVETDKLIQRTIKSEFAGATCLTIAHRLNTVLDCERVLVMHEGRVAEFDTPSNLLSDPSSMFFSLVQNSETQQ
jgi:ATP-binding cassette subfamily C (CFTR/MRP) protein 1